MAEQKNMRVLIVHDPRARLQVLLRGLGFSNIGEAPNGSEALTLLRTSPGFDLIVSDWNMEPMTGFELLREVRDDPRLKYIPFIMVTAESFILMNGDGEPENQIAVELDRVSNCNVMPFHAETLEGKMASVLESL